MYGGQFEGGQSTTTINFEEAITLPDDPEKDGYTFENWYIDINYQNELNLEGDYVDTLKVYAKWVANNNILVFNSNGGAGDMSNMTIPFNQVATLIPNTFTRENYTFMGWAETEDGSVVYEDESEYFMRTHSPSSTLYAVWVGEDVNVTIDYGFCQVDVTAKYGNLYSSILIVPESAGYIFEGWYINIDDGIINPSETLINDINDHIVFTQWMPKSITVSLDVNGGVALDDESFTVPYNSYYGELPETSRLGYAFGGWFSSLDGEIEIHEFSIVKTPINHTLYINWIPNINNLIFNSNGGTGSMENMEIATDATEVLDTNLFTRDGYTFSGWATSPSGVVVYADGASYTMGTSAEYILFAVWNVIEYNINYFLDNGTNNINNPSSYNIEDESITILLPTRTGYTFTGWFESDLTTPANTTIASGSTGDRIFYAVWEANINNLIFNSNGGTGSMENMEIATDATEVLDTNLFTRDGYTFSGWATSPSGVVVYADGASYTMGTSAEYILFAVWNSNKYTVTFDKQEGVFGSDNIQVTYDSPMPEADAPSRAGYTFAGYYTEITGGGTQYYTENMNSTKNWDITGNTTLYAKWIPNIYTVTFSVNGGNEIEFNSKQLTFNTQIGELPEVGKIGYSFVEWNSQENGLGVTYNEEMLYQVASNITLYAQWSINQYTITFNSNGGTSVTAITQDYNSVVSEPSEPTKTDFLFAGWYADASITEFYVFDRISAENITLFADWGTEGLGFSLINDNTEYAVHKGSLSEGITMSVRIPRRYNGKEVTSLGNGWTESFVNIFITSIHIPSSITVIEEYSLYGSSNLSSITIPNSVTKIGMHAFSNSNLNSINIPGSVTEIGDYAFEHCDISSVIFNEGLEKIGRGAFSQCNGLTSISLPSTLTDLGGFYGSFDDSVFADCSSLVNVTISAVAPPILSGEITMIFKGCGSLNNIYVPLQSVNAYKTAAGWSTYANKISAIIE